MRSLLCETSEWPLPLAEFSDRAPLTRLFPSLKNLPSHVRDPRYWIPEFVTGTWIPDFGFRIPLISQNPDSLSCIPDSTSKNLSDFAIRIPLHRVKSSTVALHPLLMSESVKLTAKCGAVQLS